MPDRDLVRQTPLLDGLRYIADFVCPQARLVVEVDGGVHLHRAQLDAHRDSILQRAGYRVLRIRNCSTGSPSRSSSAAGASRKCTV
jgi:very-short-patch-repair endonuclease